MEIEEGDYEDGEKEGAVDTRSVEEVGGGYEEDKVDWRGVCSVPHVSHASIHGYDQYLQKEEDWDPAT